MELKLLKRLYALGLLLIVVAPAVKSYRILAAYPFPSKSHSMMTKTLVRELIARGHQITLITGITLAPLKLGSNYTEILIDPVYDFWKDIKEELGAKNLFELTQTSAIDSLKSCELIGVKTTEHALKHPKVKGIIDAKETKGVYDLLLVEQFYQEAFLALAYKFDIPVISSSTISYEHHITQMMGLILPTSYIARLRMPFTDHMSFEERVKNTLFSVYADFSQKFVYFPKMDKLVEEHFSHLPIFIPKVSEMQKKLSLILVNGHVPLTPARPTTNAVIAVGGMHIYPAKPLPADIQSFLDEAENGAIYFALGSNVQSKDMPIESLRMFLEVFSRIKQRILWKYEDEGIKKLPPNVMIRKWLPQSDILAHPNVKVFITHGGLLGTQEGVYYAVPMLGIPFYMDQHMNMNKAVQDGYGIKLHFQSITYETLESSLLELIENPSYKQSIQRASNAFRDRPMDARDTAVYWTEYVIRHKGAAHLRSAGVDLKWYQFYLLDVFGFIAGVALLAVLLLVWFARCLLCHKQTKKQKRQ